MRDAPRGAAFGLPLSERGLDPTNELAAAAASTLGPDAPPAGLGGLAKTADRETPASARAAA